MVHMNIITPKGERFYIEGDGGLEQHPMLQLLIAYSVRSTVYAMRFSRRTSYPDLKFASIKTPQCGFWWQISFDEHEWGDVCRTTNVAFEFPPSPVLGEIPRKYRDLIDATVVDLVSKKDMMDKPVLDALLAYQESR